MTNTQNSTIFGELTSLSNALKEGTIDIEDIEVKEIVANIAKHIICGGVSEVDIKNYICEGFSDKVQKELLACLSTHLSPYYELSFLREMEFSYQTEIVTELFNRTILVSDLLDGLEAQFDLTTANLSSCKKMLNTVQHMHIVHNYSVQHTVMRITELFGFSQELAKYITHLFVQHHDKLQIICLLRHLASIERKLDPIYEVIWDALSEEN